MPTLSASFILTPPDGETQPALTDLLLDETGLLVGTTRGGGYLTTWSLAGGDLVQAGQVALTGSPTAGGKPGLAVVKGDLLTGGGTGGQMALRDLSAARDIGNPTSLGPATVFDGPLGELTTLAGADGGTLAFGTIQGAKRLAVMHIDASGDLMPARDYPAPPLSAVTATTVEGTRYLYGAYGSDPDRGLTEPGIRGWQLAHNGNLTTLEGLTAQDNLWVSAPTALATEQAGGRDFLVLASAGSSSLTVMEIGTGGALGVVDHLLDDRGTRFAGATALEVARVAGRDYVIAGGSDDGISVFLLQENERLLPRAHIADTPDLTLANIGAIAARGDATGIDIVVAGSHPGLTRLRFEIGPAGETRMAAASGGRLTGTVNADFLFGGAGADRIDGGAGDDILKGGLRARYKVGGHTE